MKLAIYSESITFKKNRLEKSLKGLEENATYHVKNIVYYPYVFYEFEVKNSQRFNRTGKKAGCTVDGINKLGAIVDGPPQLSEHKIDHKFVMDMNLSVKEASSIAQEFLQESISSRMKILTMPKLKLIKEETFYRPYWIVEGKDKSNRQFYLTVDSVTGKYHPI